MSITEIEWLDAVLDALVKVRATLARFGAFDTALEAQIDAAMHRAHLLKSRALTGRQPRRQPDRQSDRQQGEAA